MRRASISQSTTRSATYSSATIPRVQVIRRSQLDRGPSRGIVAASGAGHLQQRRSRTEPLAELLLQLVERLDHPAGADIVDHPERSAAEGREPDTEDGSDVGVARTANHPVGAGKRRLI